MTDEAAATDTGADEALNYLSMSDDDILNMAEPVDAAESTDEEDLDREMDADDSDDHDGGDPLDSGDDGSDDGSEIDSLDDESEDTDTSTPDEEGDAEASEESPAGETTDDKPTAETDYKQFYEALTSPLKANGKELTIDNVEDARRLMQMGANYNKKMAGMKPHLKTLKLLENNGLLDESKLSFYIDVEKKDPKAIAKLLKDSGIDPLDLDLEKDEYTANTYSVDDSDFELDQVLDELQGSTHAPQLIETVARKWDTASQQFVRQNPELLRVLHDHMASGVYDVITQTLERERVLGRLNGLSDLEAYRHVGDDLQAKGGFNHLFSSQSAGNTGNASTQKAEVTPPASKADETPRADKRRAARSTKAAVAPATPTDFNPLTMSDEDFEKQFDSRLM